MDINAKTYLKTKGKKMECHEVVAEVINKVLS